ncbi:hypothetical protein M569_00359, partial [Genlisea aurea]
IGFAPMKTIRFIHISSYLVLVFFLIVNGVRSSCLCYSLRHIIPSGKPGLLVFFVSAHDLNESHIHPSTCSSTLRTSPKGGGFRDISNWLSCISNKLFNGWHVELCP